MSISVTKHCITPKLSVNIGTPAHEKTTHKKGNGKRDSSVVEARAGNCESLGLNPGHDGVLTSLLTQNKNKPHYEAECLY